MCKKCLSFDPKMRPKDGEELMKLLHWEDEEAKQRRLLERLEKIRSNKKSGKGNGNENNNNDDEEEDEEEDSDVSKQFVVGGGETTYVATV